jgi:signal peptidase I, bacterial type
MNAIDNNEKKDEKQEKQNLFKEYGIPILVAVIIAFLLKSFVFERADVDGQSMQATLFNKDIIYVEKVNVLLKNIKRGQIIIFDSNNQVHDIYVKRVIGVAGDAIQIKNGSVYLNGSKLKEDYLAPNTITNPGSVISADSTYKIDKGCVFVLGDNRGNSRDSRELGQIKISDIKGHVIFRAYPFNKIKIF